MASAYPSKVDIWAPQCTRPLFNDTINSYTKVGKITKQKLLFTFFGPTIRQSRDKSVFFDKRKQFISNLQIFPNFTNPMRRRALQCDLLRPKFRYLLKDIRGKSRNITRSSVMPSEIYGRNTWFKFLFDLWVWKETHLLFEILSFSMSTNKCDQVNKYTTNIIIIFPIN